MRIFSRYGRKCKQIAFWVYQSFCQLSGEATENIFVRKEDKVSGRLREFLKQNFSALHASSTVRVCQLLCMAPLETFQPQVLTNNPGGRRPMNTCLPWYLTDSPVPCYDEFPVPQIYRKSKQVKEQWHGKFYLQSVHSSMTNFTHIGATCRPCGAKNPKIGLWVTYIPAAIKMWTFSKTQCIVYQPRRRPHIVQSLGDLRWVTSVQWHSQFLANVNSRSRSLYAIACPSVVCLSVCRLSVCRL